MSGLRFNEGKTRHDLVPAFAQEQYAKVLTAGAQKYAERNWEKGMSWSKVIASLKRHTLAFERGEDFDPETGLYHAAHMMCNAAFLLEYYKIHPQGDDRARRPIPRIGLDIDEVLADWTKAWADRFGDTPERPNSWHFDPNIRARLDLVANDSDFWLNIPRRIEPSEIPFEPHVYITARPCPSEVTAQWLIQNGFPVAPVITAESKVQAAIDSGVEIFIDDNVRHFCELNSNGICTFLYDAPHNRRYDVGFKRIYSLSEIINPKTPYDRN